MEVRELLGRLPEPDPAGVPRVWRRFQETRERERRSWRLSVWVPVLVGAAAAAAVIVSIRPEPQRTLALAPDPSGSAALAWSDEVHLTVDGHGEASGTGRDVRIDWSSGTIGVSVAPETGTRLEVVTEEGTVRVVGTLFSVRRDPLGVTTEVQRGKVEVTCADGWTGLLGASEAHTCLPVRPGALLGRADALVDLGADPAAVIDALDRGLAGAAPGSPVEGELLARRLRQRADTGAVDEALADADRYLAAGHGSRRIEVQAAAARLALGARGCEAALPYLEPLRASGRAEDRVILASCLVKDDLEGARALVRSALAEPDAALDAAWREWAETLLVEEGR